MRSFSSNKSTGDGATVMIGAGATLGVPGVGALNKDFSAPRIAPVGHAFETWLPLAVLTEAPQSLAEQSPPNEGRRLKHPSDASAATEALAKVLLDKAVALTALTLALPMLILIAALVRRSDNGPALYAHMRIGRHGRRFRCWKFRTMVPNGDEVLAAHLAASPEAKAEWEATRKLRDDPRVTRIGRLLRRTSLDELPQLFNVLKGDMSCVGPRPVVEAELEMYGTDVGDYLAVRPGLTGLWQISGRSRLGYGDRVKLDSLYVRRWSLMLDLAILVRTIPALLRTGEAV